MAVLASPARRRPAALAAGIAGLALIGCAAVAMFRDAEPVAAFPHRVHVVDQGLDCSMCHVVEEGVALPLPPDPLQCGLCHDGLDEEKPPHRRASAMFVPVPGGAEDELQLRPGLERFASEVIFDHSAHIGALEENCLACHAGMDESDRVLESDRLTMTSCTTCHEERGRADSCSVCHSEVGREWAPPSHAIGWTKLHGDASRDPGLATAMDCALCHSQWTCTECHRSTPPDNHDDFFRLRGHGVIADLSRETCATCHTSDSCIRCHESTRPMSHQGSFGSPLNTHCTGCHFPLAGESCSTCHRSTPSHALAAPQPPDHVPGANCRLCHGAGAPLPHVDDGSNCAFCHH